MEFLFCLIHYRSVIIFSVIIYLIYLVVKTREDMSVIIFSNYCLFLFQ